MADVTAQLGPIDVLVNNAGVIKVGPFIHMSPQDFDDAMKMMFWGALNTTVAVLPSRRSEEK